MARHRDRHHYPPLPELGHRRTLPATAHAHQDRPPRSLKPPLTWENDFARHPDPPGGPATSLPPVGATYLIDLQAVAGSSDYETGVGRIDTESFGRSISAIASCRRERQIEFPLNRSFTEFTSVIGPSDDSESGTTIAFSASVDDRRVDPIFIDVGSSQEFVVDVTDGFRLVLTYVSTEFSDGSCPDPAVAVWGDARLT